MKEGSVPLYYQDASTLAALIRTKQVSAAEVMKAHLDRIAAVNPKVNAITTLMGEMAVKAAVAADAMVRKGETLGPLHGVPFTIKDAIDHAGVPTQAGTRLFADNIPGKDATAVARLKAAGAIPIAKTNVPEFAGYMETDNLLTGRTNNPWDLSRTPGGSGGGESAAIAAGMSPLGIGSDLAISLRGPAALTGIAGLKATHGRIPYTGHFPRYLSRYWHIGPMARRVKDVALAYDLMQGADGADPYAHYAKNAEAAFVPPAGRPIRVGWMAGEGFGLVDPEIVAAVKEAAGYLSDLGCMVEPVRIPFLENNDWPVTGLTIYNGEMMAQVREWVGDRVNELHPIGQFLASFPDPSLGEYRDAQADVEQLKAALAAYFTQYDVLLCPVLPMLAQVHGQQEYEVGGQKVPVIHNLRITIPFNLTGNPGLSVPWRFSKQGLPINVQLVSRWFDEATILRLGQLLELNSELTGKHPVL